MTPNNEIIDLQKLTQRELLIRLHDKVEVLDGKLDKTIISTGKQLSSLNDKQTNAHVDFVKLETKVKSQSAIFGALSALIISIASIFIKIFVK